VRTCGVCSEWCDPTTELLNCTLGVASSPTSIETEQDCCLRRPARHYFGPVTSERRRQHLDPRQRTILILLGSTGGPGPPRPPWRSSSRRLQGPPRGCFGGVRRPTYSNDGTYRNASSPIFRRSAATAYWNDEQEEARIATWRWQAGSARSAEPRTRTCVKQRGVVAPVR
jgi:hypothetical protein